jgi:regulator of extracellular matrix RemA (YlzA/DUF370 family)
VKGSGHLLQPKAVGNAPLPGLHSIGAGGMVAGERVIAAGRWGSAPIRRAARRARAAGQLIDLTYGQACCWVLFMDSGHVVLAAGERTHQEGKDD